MGTRKLRILIVEDHHDEREAIVLSLAALGHWVESCADGETALDRMSYEGLDVLLTDVWLPGANAWDYLAELSKRGKLPARVISMSAGDAVEQRTASQRVGCAGHLVKPVKLKALKALLTST